MRLISSVVILAMVLVACGRPYQDAQVKSQADIKVEQLKRQYASAQQAILKCYGDAANTPDGRIVGSEVLYLKFDDPIRYQLASIKKTINSRQKTALNGYIATELQCRKVAFNSTKGLPHEKAYANSFIAMDQLYVGLLSGSMAIGEANVRKMEIQNVFVADLRSAGETVTKNLQAMRNAEFEREKQAILLMQNQQLINQNQQAIDNQYIQNLMRPFTTQSPTTLNCTTFGNQMVCN